MAWIHSARYGLEVTSDIGAKIGMVVGDDFEFLYDSELYENFTVTDEGITGDLVAFGQATQTLSCRYINDGAAKSIPFPSDWAVLDVSSPVRIAAFTKTDNGGLYNGRVYLDLKFYVEEWTAPRNTINISIGGSGSYGIKSRQLGSEVLSIAYMQSPGSHGTTPLTLDQYIGGNDNYYNRLNNGGYFDWMKKGANIPIFDTETHCNAYLMDLSDETLDGLLNASQEDPEEAYNDQFDFWYIKNVYGQNTRSLSGYTHARNYRFYPKKEGKIALLKHTPKSNEPYNYRLITQYNYNVKSSRAFEYDDEDYSPASTWYTEYLKNSVSFAENDYYTVFKWDTNIPTADSMEDIEDYFAGRKTIDEIATNWKDIARQNNDLIAPDLPGLDLDDETPTGTNGMVYTYGAKLYEMTNIELAALFSEMFTPQNLQAILDGNKLFGADVFNAISNIIYLPLSDLSAICSFVSGSNNIWIGSWESHNAQGRLISANDKIIDCGSFFFADNYGDFRSFDPYQRLYCMIPFCGFFELVVSKYIGKNVSCKIAIDITTGGVLAMLFADNIMMDQFSGQCGASRPVTARDSATYFSNIVNAITGAGGTFGNAAKGAGQAAGMMAKASGGAALAGGAAMGVGIAAVGAVGGTLKAYQIKDAVDSPPTMSSGALAGCMGYFSNTKVHFIVAQKKTVRPLNELETIGYPSNMGGTVGSFSGFLQCSAFKLADGFTGTEKERQDIMAIVKNGIYVE